MKRIILLICLVSGVNLAAQDNVVLGRITVSQANDLEFSKEYANYTDFSELELEDGNIIKVGDTLRIGIPSSGDQRISSSSMGVRSQSTFTTLMFGSPVGGALLAGLTGDDGKLLASWAGSDMLVERVLVSHTKLTRNSTLNTGVVLKELNGARRVYAYAAPRSLLLAELILLKRKLTRQEAIAKLKESRDLVDLGLMSEEDYNELMAELAPIIKGS